MNFSRFPKIIDVNLIDILMKLFAMTPLTLTKTIWCKILARSYGLIYILALVYIFYYQVQLRLVFGFPRKSQKTNFVSVLSTSILFATNILISLAVVVFKMKKYAYMVEKINDLRKITSKYSGGDKNQKYLAMMTLLVHFWYGIVTSGDVALGASGWIRTIQYYIYDSYLRYRLLVFTVYLYFLIKEVHDDLRFFNNLLKEYSGKRKMVICNRFGDDMRVTLQDICDAFVQFNEIVLNFNDIFGWILLLLLLQYFYIFLVLSNSITSLMAGYKVHWAYPMNVAILLVYATVGAVSVASICDRTTKEARKTSVLAYNLLISLNLKKNNQEQHVLSEYLTLLIKQSIHRCPGFSAADFFPVDYSTLFVLMNLLASYVVVLIQFQ